MLPFVVQCDWCQVAAQVDCGTHKIRAELFTYYMPRGAIQHGVQKLLYLQTKIWVCRINAVTAMACRFNNLQ